MSRSIRLIDAKFKAITRWGELSKVKEGIRAAQAAGLKIKINAVALKGVNDAEIPEMIRWAHGEGMDLTLIETMPLGDIEGDRTDQYLPLSVVRAQLMDQFTLEDIAYKTGGPARYVRVKETGGRLGFITPMTHNFCESCNRVRLTCTGTLYMCLGQEDAADLRAPLRASEGNDLLNAAIDEAIGRKPKGHDFIIDRRHNGTVQAHDEDRWRGRTPQDGCAALHLWPRNASGGGTTLSGTDDQFQDARRWLRAGVRRLREAMSAVIPITSCLVR